MALDGFEGELKAAAGIDRNGDCAGVAKASKMAVAGITRIGHQHFVAGTGQQAQRQQQGSRGTGRYHDPCGVDRGLPASGIKSGDGFAQGRQTECAGVVRVSGAQRRDPGRDDGFGRGEVRLADFKMDDVASDGFQRLRPRQDVHHMERCDAVHACGGLAEGCGHARLSGRRSGCWR